MQKEFLSQRGYAAHRKAGGRPGGCLRAVQKALASGRIKLTADGKIDAEAADAAWEEISPDARARRDVAQLGRTNAPETKAGASEFMKARSRTEAAKASLAELDLAVRQGSLVELREVEMEWSSLVSNIRRKFLMLSGQLGVRVARQADPAECSRIIDGAIREVLRELSAEG